MQNALQCTIAVIKVASRCNLNCSYCYMYNMGDNTYRNQPKFIEQKTAEMIVHRIAEHCEEHKVPDFMFVLHGGEPLLASREWYRHFVEYANKVFEPLETKSSFVIQTNGVLLDDAWCELFLELDIALGISLDGTRKDHDHYRKDHAGRGSYEQVLRGIELSQKVLGYANIIAVINIDSDPDETYHHLSNLGVSNIHLLLPDANFEQLPPQKKDTPPEAAQDQYAEWLIRMFDLWMEDTNEKKPGIRIFTQLLRMLWGARTTSDSLGTERNEVIVIETNGDYESLDSLKICGEGFTKADANVEHTTLNEALNSELARMYHLSHENLCTQCSNCDINELCGGGNLPHRYHKSNGFDNPTVYCRTQARLITHIQNRWVEGMPADFVKESGVNKIKYDDLLESFAAFPQPGADQIKVVTESNQI